MDFQQLLSVAIDWLSESYKAGFCQIRGSALLEHLRTATDFDRVPRTGEEAAELSAISGRFLAVLTYLGDEGMLVVADPRDGYISKRVSFGRKLLITSKVLGSPAISASDDDDGYVTETTHFEPISLPVDQVMPFFRQAFAFREERPQVTIDPPQIVLDGQPIALKPNQAIYLQALIDSADWLSDPEFKRRRPEVGATARPEKWRSRLPEIIQQRIETHQSKGSRWKM